MRSGRPACPCSRAPVGGGQRSILHSRHFSRLRYREKCAAFAPLVTNAADRTATRHSSSTPRPAIPTLRGRSGGSEADVRAARNGHWQHGIKSATLAPILPEKPHTSPTMQPVARADATRTPTAMAAPACSESSETPPADRMVRPGERLRKASIPPGGMPAQCSDRGTS